MLGNVEVAMLAVTVTISNHNEEAGQSLLTPSIAIMVVS